MVPLKLTQGAKIPFQNEVANDVLRRVAAGNRICETAGGEFYLEGRETVGIDRAIVAALIAGGYLERKKPAADNLRGEICLTDKGRGAAQDIPE